MRNMVEFCLDCHGVLAAAWLTTVGVSFLAHCVETGFVPTGEHVLVVMLGAGILFFPVSLAIAAICLVGLIVEKVCAVLRKKS